VVCMHVEPSERTCITMYGTLPDAVHVEPFLGAHADCIGECEMCTPTACYLGGEKKQNGIIG
jgi:hypothetical protein